MRYQILRAMAETAMAHQLTSSVPVAGRVSSLTPELTLPVFSLPAGLKLVEAVAVTYRDLNGKPVDGGLFGVTATAEVVRLALVDTERGVNTDRDPAWVAIGMSMTVGKLMVKGDDAAYELPWSIVDCGERNPRDGMATDSPARRAVREAVLAALPNEVGRAGATKVHKSLSELYGLWDQLRDVAVVEDATRPGSALLCLDQPFLHFSKGAEVEEVWHWFERQNPQFIVGDVMQGIRVDDDGAEDEQLAVGQPMGGS